MNIKKFFNPYLDRRMLRILLLGIMSGFPWVLIGSALSLWLKDNDLSRTTIGWAGLIFGVYAINLLWAPLIDRLNVPFLSKKIGHRKSWIILMQVVIFISLLSWSFLDPSKNMGKQLSYGSKRGNSIALICGENEFKDNTVTLKNLLAKKGEDNQITIPRKDLINEIRKIIPKNN